MPSPMLFTAFLVLAAVLCAFLAIAAFLRRSAAGARAFGALMLASVVYALGSAFELSSPSLPSILLFVKIEYVGIVLIPPLWLVFALRFSERPLPRAPVLALLFLEPLATLSLIWTNEYHRLFYSRAWIRPDGPFALVAVEHGPAYWIHTVSMWAMLAASICLLVRYAAIAPEYVKRGARIAVAGILVPLASNLLLISGATPYGIDLGPFALVLSGLLFAWAMLSRRFLDFLPVARERVLESLHDGLVILDAAGRVADFNPAARTLLGLGSGADREEVSAALQGPELSALAVAGEGDSETVLVGEEGARRIHARAFPVGDERGRPVGAYLLFTDVTETAALMDRLAELASMDSLTGSLNRRRFDEIGSRDLELARRKKTAAGVLMIDLDFFKRVNDEWGHPAGDEVLRVVCGRCRGELRNTDAFARYGGEEFAVFLPNSDPEGTVVAAERLRAVVSRESIPWEGRGISVTVSIGAYSGIPVEGESLERFLRFADEALYAAKARGRDRVVLWSPVDQG